jgi:6-pyruvoyltetrahydropterin/6-carboxytetrahydropterin synthase
LQFPVITEYLCIQFLSEMIRLTKVFRFETAHAIHGYNGQCKDIHGHSYVLHATVAGQANNDDYIPAPGFVFDFKDLKKAGVEIVETLDHKLVLSKDYIAVHPEITNHANVVIWDFEPTAENILLYVKGVFLRNLPEEIKLVQLKIYETENSYAEWVAD